MIDPVHNPPHYQSGGIEVIDVIEAFELGFRLANVVKYVLRAGRKGDALEDLRKAAWYLDREIDKMEIGASKSGKQTNAVEVDVTTREDVARRMARVFFNEPIPTTGGIFVSEVAHAKPVVCADKQEYNG